MNRINHIQSIEFAFENCEFIEFSSKYIGRITLNNISRSIERVAVNAIADLLTVGDVCIEIFSEGNDDYSCYGLEPKKKFWRILEYDDITSILVHYDDGSTEEFYVDYDEGENEGLLGAPNVNQSTVLSDLGNLYIVISRNSTVDDVIDETINDEETVRTAKKLYGLFESDEDRT